MIRFNLIVGSSLTILLFLFACKTLQVEAPDAQSGRELEAHAAKLAHCREVGRDSGKYTDYEDCKAKDGIK